MTQHLEGVSAIGGPGAAAVRAGKPLDHIRNIGTSSAATKAIASSPNADPPGFRPVDA